jgi:hypothetical protein
VKYTIQKVVGLTEQKQPVGSESILLIVQASVQAGIDLASLGPDDVMVRPDGTVVVLLPAAKILHVSIDETETKVWDRQKTWCGERRVHLLAICYGLCAADQQPRIASLRRIHIVLEYLRRRSECS